MQRRLTIALLLAALLGTVAAAQEWRGMGRVSGKVTDESGAPVEGVEVVATMGAGRFTARTNRNGDWAIGGVGRGEWALDFTKEGFETRRISVGVSDSSRERIETVMKKAAPAAADPNVEIKAELEKAAQLLTAGKHADARSVYEALLVKFPEAYQIHPLIARTYSAENQHDKAVEHLKLALERQPENVEWKLVLGSELAIAGRADEAQAVMSSIDEAKVKDATPYLNIGITLYNANKGKEAQAYFEKAITLFPKEGDAYYYRALTHLQLGSHDAAKADLTKFLELAPTAPEADTARKILSQLK